MSGPPLKGPYDPDRIRERVEREAMNRPTPRTVTADTEARSDLRRQFDRLLDDRWPLAGPLLRAVDEYVAQLALTPSDPPRTVTADRLRERLTAFMRDLEAADWNAGEWDSVLERHVALTPSDPLDVDRLRSPRNSLGKLALPKGLMERAVEKAWDAPGVRTDIGDPSEGIVMTSLSELADAICDALVALSSKADPEEPHG